MKADPADQEKLLDLHELDVQLGRTAGVLRLLPEQQRVDQAEAAVQSCRASQREALRTVDDLRAELTRAENDVELVEKRIATDQERSSQTTSAKDATGLEHEIATLRERLAVLEDVELEVMTRLDEAEKVLSASSAETTQAESELDTAIGEAERARKELEHERESLTAARAELVGFLPGDLVELYERQRKRYGFGASLLRARISQASGVTLTESDLQTVRQAAPDDVLMCPDSNAILVRIKESGL